MVNPVGSRDSAFPTLDSAVVDEARRATLPWANFWRALWRRTGGADGMLYPIEFHWIGAPGAGGFRLFVAPVALLIPANLAGTKVFDGTQATANSAFLFRRATTGFVLSTIGTVTVTPTTHYSATLATSAAVTLLAGDGIIASAPAVADATLADVAITIPARVA